VQMVRLYLIALVTVVVVVACDRVPLTSPTGSTITLSIERNILPLNGQTTVRAVVTESSGTPVHNGTMVTFQPSIGRTEPVDAATVNGIATVQFLAGGMSGTGIIHAFSGGARTGSGNTSGGGVEVRIGAAAAGSIAVSSTPPSVSQSGGSVTISALVLDESNNPLPGVSVLFAASTGTLSSTSALSDSNGIARTSLTTTQTTTVTAIAGAAKGEVQVVVSTAPSVLIDAPTAAVVGVPIAVTITPQGGTGTNTSPRQLATVVVDFGDGNSQTLTNITGASGLTHTYTRPGGFTISARSTDVNGNTGLSSRAIVVTRAVPTVTVTLSDTTPQVNQIIGFTITATPGTGGPPIESIRAFIDGELVFSGTGSTGAFSKGFSAQGTYLLDVQATDAGGNVGRAQQFITVTP
jgi:hypothetical protein